jgi:hypothetical protein
MTGFYVTSQKKNYCIQNGQATISAHQGIRKALKGARQANHIIDDLTDRKPSNVFGSNSRITD